MTVWSHLPTIFKQRHALLQAGLLTLFVAFITTLLLNSAAYAAPGVNQTLNFQGRLLNSSGGTVPDGNYNMQFKIYQDGTATEAGTLEWTESHLNNASHGITVKNGYFSVTLGSVTPFGNDVDWNQDSLYLSMNVGTTAGGCTPFSSCGGDGEMMPMKRLTAVPFALNAGRLEGRSADDFIQSSTSPQNANFNITGTGTATSLQATTLDTASAGTLTIGGTNATDITLADDVTIAAGKSLTLAGGTTASRPASPSEGTLWFDTDLKKLVIYADGKWVPLGGGAKTATKIVAASNSPADIKNSADYVADGTGDQAEINAALIAAAGGKVYLAEGTYTISAAISVPNNTTLAGAGAGTVITIPNSLNTSINAITNTTTGGSGTNITVQNIKLDGNRTNQASGTMQAIYFDGVGSGTGSSATQGGKLHDLQIVNWRSTGILLNASSNNTISNNVIQNTGGSDAIRIENNTSTANYLTNNTLAGSAINDAGTDTTYANQLDASGKLINKSSGGSTVQTSTNNATAFQVQNAAGTSALTVNTTSNTVLVAGALDTTTATTLSIGTSTATAITMGSTSGNILTTMNGRALIKSTTGNNSTTAFQVQNASSTALLTADTTNMQVIIGNGSDTITLSASGITLAGNARGTKQIRLAAEYQNTVLDSGATGNNSGTMLSSLDLTNRMNFYRWSATPATAQTYDIVAQVAIPQDFSAWAASNPLSITSRTDSTTDGTMTMELRDSSGTVRCNFTGIAMGSANTWITNTPNCLSNTGTTYTPGDYLTIRLRMSAKNSAKVDVGNIVLNYLSNK